MPGFSYRLTSFARKKLKKLPVDIQRRIIIKIKFFCQTNPLVYAEKLSDFELGDYRFRIGDYRVIFDVNGTVITIINLGHRREIYR